MRERGADGRGVLPGMITYMSRAHYPPTRTLGDPSAGVSLVRWTDGTTARMPDRTRPCDR
eukprot:4753553-Pleurochrysis_carterae.AAC.1